MLFILFNQSKILITFLFKTQEGFIPPLWYMHIVNIYVSPTDGDYKSVLVVDTITKATTCSQHENTKYTGNINLEMLS